MADFDVVVEKLLGFEDADSLADYFGSYGIVATPKDSRSCAISRFVEIETGATNCIVTSTSSISLIERKIDDTNNWKLNEEEVIVYQHSTAMSEFVENFDRGMYPNLVENKYEWEHDVDSCDCCY